MIGTKCQGRLTIKLIVAVTNRSSYDLVLNISEMDNATATPPNSCEYSPTDRAPSSSEVIEQLNGNVMTYTLPSALRNFQRFESSRDWRRCVCLYDGARGVVCNYGSRVRRGSNIFD